MASRHSQITMFICSILNCLGLESSEVELAIGKGGRSFINIRQKDSRITIHTDGDGNSITQRDRVIAYHEIAHFYRSKTTKETGSSQKLLMLSGEDSMFRIQAKLFLSAMNVIEDYFDILSMQNELDRRGYVFNMDFCRQYQFGEYLTNLTAEPAEEGSDDPFSIFFNSLFLTLFSGSESRFSEVKDKLGDIRGKELTYIYIPFIFRSALKKTWTSALTEIYIVYRILTDYFTELGKKDSNYKDLSKIIRGFWYLLVCKPPAGEAETEKKKTEFSYLRQTDEKNFPGMDVWETSSGYSPPLLFYDKNILRRLAKGYEKIKRKSYLDFQGRPAAKSLINIPLLRKPFTRHTKTRKRASVPVGSFENYDIDTLILVLNPLCGHEITGNEIDIDGYSAFIADRYFAEDEGKTELLFHFIAGSDKSYDIVADTVKASYESFELFRDEASRDILVRLIKTKLLYAPHHISISAKSQAMNQFYYLYDFLGTVKMKIEFISYFPATRYLHIGGGRLKNLKCCKKFIYYKKGMI